MYINIIKNVVCIPKTNLHGNVVFFFSNTAGKLSFNLSIILIDIWMLRIYSPEFFFVLQDSISLTVEIKWYLHGI